MNGPKLTIDLSDTPPLEKFKPELLEVAMRVAAGSKDKALLDLLAPPDSTPNPKDVSALILANEVLSQLYKYHHLCALLCHVGICPDCEQEFVHHIDNQAVTCGCGTSEWVGGWPLIFKLRRALKQSRDAAIPKIVRRIIDFFKPQ